MSTADEDIADSPLPDPPLEDDSSEHTDDNLGRQFVEEQLRQKIYVEHFGRQAGAIMDSEEAEEAGFSAYSDNANIYAPFLSRIDWDVAKWAKLRGPSSTALTELFKIPQVCLFVLNSSKLYNLLQFI